MITGVTVTKDYLKFVESETTYKIRCSDCECYGDDFFNEQQAADLSEREGWKILGDNVRIVCGSCAKGYPADY